MPRRVAFAARRHPRRAARPIGAALRRPPLVSPPFRPSVAGPTPRRWDARSRACCAPARSPASRWPSSGTDAWSGPGLRNLERQRETPVTPAVFEAASLSKPVFAYLVLRLADRGEFDLDRPLSRTLEYPRLAHDERYHRITARMVLSHGNRPPQLGRRATDAAVRAGHRVQLLRRRVRLPPEDSGAGHRQDSRSARPARGVRAPRHDRSGYVWQDRFPGNAAYGRNWLWHVAPAHRYTRAGNAAASLLTTAPTTPASSQRC